MFRRRGSLNFNRRRRQFNKALFHEILTWMLQIVVVVMVALFMVYLFGLRTYVVGGSMENTLLNNESVLVNRLAYTVGQPDLGDVIVFRPNGNKKSHYYIRRVVARSGDTIQIKDGVIYVNGEIYQEKIEVASIENPGIAEEPITLGNGEYFVLGDNRNNSEDSRYANIGVVKKEYIEGKAWFRFSSLGNMGFVR